MQAHLVRVEVEGRRGPPYFELVGLAEAAVRESRVRVKSALAQVGVDIGECRIVVNLAPADVKKTGSGFDLAIAAAAAGALGRRARARRSTGVLFLGELSLEGTVQPLRGVLPQLLGRARRGRRSAPSSRAANAAEAALVDGVDVRTAASLRELLDGARGQERAAGGDGAARRAARPPPLVRRSRRRARPGRGATRARDRGRGGAQPSR